eukprot:2684821-Alexandrium_andersonii.AAC.2
MCVLAPNGCGLNQVGRTTCCQPAPARAMVRTQPELRRMRTCVVRPVGASECGSCGCGLNQ